MADENRVELNVGLNIDTKDAEKQGQAAGATAGQEYAKAFNKTVMANWRPVGTKSIRKNSVGTPGITAQSIKNTLKFPKAKEFGFSNPFVDGIKGASLRQAAANLDMTGKKSRLFETPAEMLQNGLLGGVYESVKDFSAKLKNTKPVADAASSAVSKFEIALGTLSQKAKSSGIKNLLLYGTNQTQKDRNVAVAREALLNQRARVESMTPTESDRELAARELNRGRWTIEAKKAVKDARARIKAYDEEVAALQKLERQYEKMDKSGGTLFSGLLSSKGSRAVEKKLGVLLDKNSIFDKKTIADNGLLSTAGYKVLRMGEIGIHGFKNALEGLKSAAKTELKKKLGGVLKIVELFGKRFRSRVITNAIKAIIRVAKEGLANLKAYSQDLGTPFYSNVMRLSASLVYLKNAFAAMVAPLINYVTPMLERFMDLLASLANQIGAFFAAITGQKQFSAALKRMVTDADSAAGKLLDILGFDELNRLSGDTGGGVKYEEMFEEWDPNTGFFGKLRELVKNKEWSKIGKEIGKKINSLVEGFDAQELGKKFGEKVQAAVDILSGFISQMNFKAVGEKIATFLNNTLNSVNWTQVGTLLTTKITALFDIGLGFISKLDWAKVGESLGGFLSGIIRGLTDWIKDQDWQTLGERLGKGLVDMVKNIKPMDIIQAVWELLKAVALGAWELLKGLIGGLLVELIDSIPDSVFQILKLDKNTVKINIQAAFNMSQSDRTAMSNMLTLINKGLRNDKYNTAAETFAAPVLNSFGNSSSSSSLGYGVDEYTTVYHEWLENIRSLLGKFGIGGFASGGTPTTGQLFIANEAGPELVGTVGGRTTVTNQDQFTQGLADANVGVIAALGEVIRAINNKDTTVVMDGQKVAQTVTKHQRNFARQYGV